MVSQRSKWICQLYFPDARMLPHASRIGDLRGEQGLLFSMFFRIFYTSVKYLVLNLPGDTGPRDKSFITAYAYVSGYRLPQGRETYYLSTAVRRNRGLTPDQNQANQSTVICKLLELL